MSYEQLVSEINARRDLMDNVREVLAYDNGELLFKNLLKALDVNAIPHPGLKGEELHNDLGFMRATKVIVDLLMEADPLTTTKILTSISVDKLKQNYEEQMKELERLKHV